MRVRVELETMTDINKFCSAVSNINADIYLTDNINRFKVNAKSIIGLMLAKIEWSEIFCECEEDIYSAIEPWVARNSNVTIHD